MHFVDTHFHLWDLEANYYPWLTDKVQPRVIGEYASIRKDYVVADFLRDAEGTGVTKAVHIEAAHDPSDPVRETRWVQSVADDPASRGFPQAIIAYADLGAPNAQETIEAHCQYPNMRGIRQSLIQHKVDPKGAQDPRQSPTWATNFKLLQAHDLSFDLQLFPADMADGADIVAHYPSIQFVLTHAGLPMRREPEDIEAWRGGMRLLAARRNVAVKLSGFGFMDRSWTPESIRPTLTETIDIFGVDRCMLASNFPVDSMSGGYKRFWLAFDALTRQCSETDRAKIFHANAEAIYRI